MTSPRLREAVRLSFMFAVLVACTSWAWFPALAGTKPEPEPEFVPFHFWATECIDQDCVRKGFRVWYEDHSVSKCVCRDSKTSGGPDSDCTKYGFFCETLNGPRD